MFNDLLDFLFSFPLAIGIGGLVSAILAFIQLRLSRQIMQRTREDIIAKALDVFVTDVFKGMNVRANVFLWDREKEVLNIIFGSSNTVGKSDRGITYEKWQGAVGTALASNTSVVADLDLTKKDNRPAWNLSPDQVALTSHLKSILAIPIHRSKTNEVIGVLSFDSSDPIADDLSKPEVVQSATNASAVIAKLLETVGET